MYGGSRSWAFCCLLTYSFDMCCSDAWNGGKNWRREEKGTMEDEIVGWHHQLDGCKFWVTSRSWWGTGKPRVLQSMGSWVVGKIEGGRRRDNSGWDGWMASLTRWTWVWVSSGSFWWTGKPGVLQSMWSQRVRHDWETELNWTDGVVQIQVSSHDNLGCRHFHVQDLSSLHSKSVWYIFLWPFYRRENKFRV